jgi:alkyl hydroperoxide reductase subunit AhpC
VSLQLLGRWTIRKTKTDNLARIDHQDATNVDSKGIAFTIRSVFVIDPKKTIRTILSYPASTGRNTAEVLRIVDSLQTGDKHRITTPINWVPGHTKRMQLLTRQANVIFQATMSLSTPPSRATRLPSSSPR